jgi:hypothetical protein
VDLLYWGAPQLRAIQQRRRLSVAELDICMKQLRTVVSRLDDLTVEQRERDPRCGRISSYTRSDRRRTKRSTIYAWPKTIP